MGVLQGVPTVSYSWVQCLSWRPHVEGRSARRYLWSGLIPIDGTLTCTIWPLSSYFDGETDLAWLALEVVAITVSKANRGF